MRLLSLISTLAVFGLAGFFVGKLTFNPSAIDTYVLILAAIGTISSVSSFFTGQSLSRFEKLLEFPLEPLQSSLFREKLRRRRSRDFIKFGIGLATGILAVASGGSLRIWNEPILAGIGIACAAVSLISVSLMAFEYRYLARLLDDLTEKSEQKKRDDRFWNRPKHSSVH
jgi:hypothetical protein